jgi:hypothetical protein
MSSAAPKSSSTQLVRSEEIAIELTPINNTSQRITKSVGSSWIQVENTQVEVEATHFITLTPIELNNVIQSGNGAKKNCFDPAIVGFDKLLKCVELIKNGDKYELFLRCTTHDAESGVLRNRLSDESRLFSMRVATLMEIKERFSENGYALSELSPNEIWKLQNFFDKQLGDSADDEGDQKSFRINAKDGDAGFQSDERVRVGTLAHAHNHPRAKRLREEDLAEQADKAKHIKKLDSPALDFACFSFDAINGKIISMVQTDDGRSVKIVVQKD